MTDGRHHSDPSDSVDAPWRGTALRDLASALPTVTSALEDFIARANQTERAVVAWDADPAVNGAGAASAEAGAALRDAAAREQVLQRQLDELQTRLASAVARAAVATPAAEAARAEAAPAAEAARAEAPAIATPRAPIAAPRTPWPAIAGAFVGGIVVMLVASRLLRDDRRPVRPAPAVESPVPSAVELASPRPTVTPIEPAARAPVAAPPQVEPPQAPPVPAEHGAPTATSPPPARPRPAGATAPPHPPARPAPGPADTLADPFGAAHLAKPPTPPPPARPADPKPSGQLVNPF